MIPILSYAGRRVGVLGLGRSGLATARALKAGGAEPVCWDDDEAAREAAAGEGFEVADLSREREAATLGCLVVSPGIAQLYPAPHPAVVRARAAGVPVDNDVGLFFAEFLGRDDEAEPEPKIVAVTGSNGKSTTTALIHHILKAAGRPTQIGGNIGRGVLDLDMPEAGEVTVLELSSYQIELARTLAPDIAVFLNLTPDHLERHGGIGGYFAAKRRLFELGSPTRSVIGIDEPEGRSLASIADAAEKALLAYDNIRWIAGGRPKAGGIEPLRPLFAKIAKAYLIGEAEAAFAATLGDTPHARCGTLAKAVGAARADARPGDVILLSPACASWDQFASFEARGEAFRALVAPVLRPDSRAEAGR